jgi:hypothetical protein
MSLKGMTMSLPSDNGNYFETLITDEKLKIILEMVVERYNLRIEFREYEAGRLDSTEWLIDEANVSDEPYLNSYIEKRVIVDIRDANNHKGEKF